MEQRADRQLKKERYSRERSRKYILSSTSFARLFLMCEMGKANSEPNLVQKTMEARRGEARRASHRHHLCRRSFEFLDLCELQTVLREPFLLLQAKIKS